MRFAALVGALAAAACGRLDFNASSSDATLMCGAPTRFQIGAANATALAAVAEPDGYAVFTADSAGALVGRAFAFDGTTLVTLGDVTTLGGGATGALGVAAQGSSLMLASADGMPTATGTTLFPLATALGSLATPASRSGQLAATFPLAPAAGGGFAFVTIDATTKEIDARRVTETGVDAGAPVMIVDPSALASNVSIVAVPAGYVVSYSAGSPSPNHVELELLDAGFNVIAGPVSVDNSGYDEYRPSVAAIGGVYLIAWHAKDVTDDDDVWIQLRAADLSAITAPAVAATFSSGAVVAADASGFWVAWSSYGTAPNRLGAAHVALDGTTTLRPVTSSGGSPGKWTMIARQRQPVLAWTEVGGTGPDLYLDPMCPL